jgi:hypothetical protein
MKAFVLASVLYLVPASVIQRVGYTTVRTIAGKVIGFDDSLPLEGVTVTIKGTHTATGTQPDGTFYIRVNAPEDSILVFQRTGYKTQELKLTQKSDYDVVLERAGR